MKCIKIKERFADLLSGEIDNVENKKIREHIAECDSCRDELESLSEVWAKLEVLPTETPGEKLRSGFYSMLEENIRSSTWEKIPDKGKNKKRRKWYPGFFGRKLSFSVMTITIVIFAGLISGYLISSKLKSGQIMELRNELKLARQSHSLQMILNRDNRIVPVSLFSDTSKNPEIMENIISYILGGSKISPPKMEFSLLSFPFGSMEENEKKKGLISSLSDGTQKIADVLISITGKVKTFSL